MLGKIKEQSTLLHIIGLGICLTFFQIFITLLLTPSHPSIQARFFSLNNWDSSHYADIIDHGYRLPSSTAPQTGPATVWPLAPPPVTKDDIHQFRTNLGFFPAYPLLAKEVKSLLNCSTEAALLFTAQGFTVLFWIYFILLIQLNPRRDSTVPKPSIKTYCILLCLYPSSFFLITGYSESLFMASLLGFIYWTDHFTQSLKINFSQNRANSLAFWGLAALHGMAMSSTRVVGIPVTLYPLIILGISILWPIIQDTEQNRWHSIRKSTGLILLTPAALLAPFAFFMYCEIHFGAWNWYFKIQEIGWGNEPNYFAIFDPRSYIPYFFFEHTVTSLNRAAIPFITWMFYSTFRSHSKTERVNHLGLYTIAGLLFYIALSGKARANMDSMIRYTLPSYAILLIAQTSQPNLIHIKKNWIRKSLFILIVIIQIWFIFRFLRGRWVA